MGSGLTKMVVSEANEIAEEKIAKIAEEGAGWERWIPLGLFGFIMLVYSLTLCRTVYTGDDGDLITAMTTLGVCHPTGYPLFMLLGKVFTFIPLGEPAFRANLMVAIFAALASLCVYRVLLLLVREWRWAAFGTLLFAFTTTLWHQSMSCEVYSLETLFVAALLLLTLRWMETPENDRLLYTIALTYGFSLTHHLMLALLLPGFAVLVFYRRPQLLRDGKRFLTIAVLVALPLLLYFYLPLVTRYGNAPIKWGQPDTWETTIQHISGKAYQHMMFSRPDAIPFFLRDYLTVYLPEQFGIWFLWLIPFGIAFLWQSPGRRPFLWLLVSVFLVNVGYSVGYFANEIYVFYIPSYVVVAILIACGGKFCIDWLLERYATPKTYDSYNRLMTICLAGLALVHTSFHYGRCDKSGNYLESDLARNILLSAPPNGLVLIRQNTIFSLWYRQFVLKERPDVVVINLNLFDGFGFGAEWYYDHLAPRLPELARAYPTETLKDKSVDKTEAILRLITICQESGRPVLLLPRRLSAPMEIRTNDAIKASHELIAWGLLTRIYPKGFKATLPEVYKQNLELWSQYEAQGLYTGWAHNDPLQDWIPEQYANAGITFGRLSEAVGEYAIAEEAYSKALTLFPEIPVAQEGLKRVQVKLEGK